MIEVEGVWKMFRKGEYEDSLRDLIPAMVRRALGRAPRADAASKEFWALKDITFQVQKGESLGIIGPNGAGKSTLLKLLCKIIRPNRGRFAIHGRLSAMIEVGAGFHHDLSGRENIYLNGAILGMKRREIRAKEDAIIDFSGVSEFIDTPVKRYSSGMKARLGFAVAAHLEPEVLLIDEVLSVGDVAFRAKCVRHMQSLLNSNVTVIFISHILDQVRSLCPNTVVLDKGAVAYNGPTEGAIAKYLDLLSDNERNGPAQAVSDAEIRNVRFCDAVGSEVLNWNVRQPGVVEFDLLLRRRLQTPSILINYHTIGGMYLGTANSLHQGMTIPSEPGHYRLRFTLDPMPLADGDFNLEFKINEGEDQHTCVWWTRQPRTVSVRGGRGVGPVVQIDGQWEVVEHLSPVPAVAQTVR